MSSKFKVQSSRFKVVIICSFVSFAVFACTSGNATHRELSIAESKSYEASLFRQNCAICHGREANGREMDGKLIPSLRYGEAASLSEEQIYTQIHDGKLPMPAFKNQLTEDEIRRMAKFIKRDLQGKEGNR